MACKAIESENQSKEQTDLGLDYKDNILCKLKRSEKPLESSVEVDEFTDIASECFDFDFNGTNQFYGFEMPKELEGLDFQILAIVGQSGSGKSVFSRYFGKEEEIKWDRNKAIISHFKDKDDAIERLSCVGLNSIPTWVKPRHVLSVGEGFRADLARRISNDCVIDEYTSVVDRDVAKSCSVSLQKYIRRKELKGCVFVSCHKDFIDYLRLDYVVDLDDEVVYDTRELPQRGTRLQIFEEKNKQSIWRMFRRHHYLSHEINLACRIVSFRLDDKPIAMVAILPLPNGAFDNGYRLHRIVVLPEYQGMSIGTKIIKVVCNMLAFNGKVAYVRTSHERLRTYFAESDDWQETKRSGTISPSLFLDDVKPRKERVAYSFKYVAPYRECNYKAIDLPRNEKGGFEQIVLF